MYFLVISIIQVVFVFVVLSGAATIKFLSPFEHRLEGDNLDQNCVFRRGLFFFFFAHNECWHFNGSLSFLLVYFLCVTRVLKKCKALDQNGCTLLFLILVHFSKWVFQMLLTFYYYLDLVFL